jgi:hypothetical protein
MPAYVTFRFTDILRASSLSRFLWQAGYHLGFTSATVIQERNPHDYLRISSQRFHATCTHNA